jgi:hypothetical protein
MKFYHTKYLMAILLIAGVTAVGAITPALASGEGHGDTEELKHQVDLEGKTGFNLFLARTYNNNRLLYALVVTAVMAVLGIVVAQVTETVLKLIGVK